MVTMMTRRIIVIIINLNNDFAFWAIFDNFGFLENRYKSSFSLLKEGTVKISVEYFDLWG